MRIIEIRNAPIDLILAKYHLRVGDAVYDDIIIEEKIGMAVSVAEGITGRIIRECVIEMNVVFSSINDVVQLPVPTKELLELSYFDNGNKIILNIDSFNLKNFDNQAVLYLLTNELVGKEITVKIICGYNANDIPKSMSAAILLILGTLYDNESNDVIGRSVSKLSITAENILDKFRIMPYV